MTDQEKGELIGLIIGQMRRVAKEQDRHFDAADLFFSLAFCSPSKLNSIAKHAGVL